jgi:formate dehydrogenase subunit gamma
VTAGELATLESILDALKALEGPLLPVLHEVQEHFGCIPERAVPAIAQALNLSRAEVHGVASFYHDFRAEPAGRHTVEICAAEACQAVGARAVEQFASQALGVATGATTADGAVTLQRAYCLGNCACGPSVRIDGELHALVDTARIAQLLTELRRG